MDEDVRDAVQRPRPHLKGDVRIIFFEHVANCSPQVPEEVVRIVILALHVGRFPVIEQVPHDVADPLRTFRIIFLRAALLGLVVVALDDGRARDTPEREGDGCFSEVFRLERHGSEHDQFGRGRHLVPRPSFKIPPGLLLLYAAPLLKEERYATLQALIADASHPFRVHRARVRS